MATSHYFNNSPASPTFEQQFIEDNVNEIIHLFGQDVFYVPRTSMTELDTLYGESPAADFRAAYPIEAYLDEPMGPSGAQAFFSKFGMGIPSGTKWIIANNHFKRWVPSNTFPKEGDLIWYPGRHILHEIKYVNQNIDYGTAGRRPPNFYMYELTVEPMKFNNERFATGLVELDSLMASYSYTINLPLTPGSGNYVIGELVYQGVAASNATISGIVKNWIRSNNMLQVISIKGTFGTSNVIGNTSGAIYTANTYDGRDFTSVFGIGADNEKVADEADAVLTFDTDNPFGEAS